MGNPVGSGTLGLLCLIWLLVAPLQAAESPRIALVIGNAAYKTAPLANPVNDADLVSEALRKVGFKVLQHSDLSQKAMKLAVREFGDTLEQAGANAVGLFYYSGHGIQVHGRNYMIPVSADIRRESDIDIEGVAADIVLGTMAFARNRLNLVIMDACRNNPFARSFRSATRGLARMDATKGTLIAYSTAPGQVAVDGEGRNSPYTLALANAMQRSRLPVEQVFKEVRRTVMSATGNLQVPWESSSLTGDFYFSGGPTAVAVSAVPPVPGSGASNAEVLFWESIKDSRDPAAFQAYLEQFPEGVFSGLASIRGQQAAAVKEPVARSAAPDLPPDSSPAGPLELAAAAPKSADAVVSVTAPRAVDAGGGFEVEWVAPDDKKAFITIVAADADPGTYRNYAYTRSGNPLKLRAPDEPGEYEIRYLAGQGRATLAVAPIRVHAVSATLEAPEAADAGSEIRVRWEGPDHKQDFITVVEQDAEEGAYGHYRYTRDGSPLKLLAPDGPGVYEIRYLTGQSRMTLASLALQVNAVTVQLEAPESVDAGSEIRVSWEGPGNKKDFITVVKRDADEGVYGKYTYTREGNSLKLRVPDEPGDYEIRYLAGQSRVTLASSAVRVNKIDVALEAPESVAAGSQFRVSWQGPDNQRDFITIVESEAEERSYGNHTYSREGNPLKLLAPDAPGNYEIRYLAGQSYSSLARIPVRVEAVTASLEAPLKVGAGSEFKIVWQGPDNPRDFITIVEVGADIGSYGNHEYTRNGKPFRLSAPDQPGSYEIRYLTGQTRSTLASVPIEVLTVKATLEAPARIPAGTKFKVIWTGPGNKKDFVTIVEPEAEDGSYGKHTYTRNGNPLKLLAPSGPGSYEIRYLTGQNRRTLARRRVTVE